MPSERTINPAQAHRKAEKAKALKKSKTQLAAQRAEKLARRNPNRLERQIEALVEEEGKSGSLRPKDKQTLDTLRKDVAAIKRAREKLGVRGDDRGFGGGDGGGGGTAGRKRKWDGDGDGNGDRRDGRDGRGREQGCGREGFERRRNRQDFDEGGGSDDGFSTDESVRRIPMPRDTPPPIPAARRWQRHDHNGRDRAADNEARRESDEGHLARNTKGMTMDEDKASTTQAKTVYEAAPAVRDLRKEATAKFIPSAVKGKLDLVQGKGRLLEEDEVVSLSKSGYVKNDRKPAETYQTSYVPANLDDEEKRFETELNDIPIPEAASKMATVEDAEDN